MCVLVAASQHSSPRGAGGSTPWKSRHVLPPARVPLVGRQLVRVDVGLPVRHRARGPEHERDVSPARRRAGARSRRPCGPAAAGRATRGRASAARPARRARHALVEGRARARAQQRRHLGARVAEVVVAVAQLVVRRPEPVLVRPRRSRASGCRARGRRASTRRGCSSCAPRPA